MIFKGFQYVKTKLPIRAIFSKKRLKQFNENTVSAFQKIFSRNYMVKFFEMVDIF